MQGKRAVRRHTTWTQTAGERLRWIYLDAVEERWRVQAVENDAGNIRAGQKHFADLAAATEYAEMLVARTGGPDAWSRLGPGYTGNPF